MKSVTGYLQMILAWGLVGALVVTLIVPTINRMLLTPPVSFGMNCEPAANWSVHALIKSQGIGLAIGILVGIGTSIFWRRRRPDLGAATTPPAASTTAKI